MNRKNIESVLLIMVMIFSLAGTATAEENDARKAFQDFAYHKPNVVILYNEEEIGFFDINGTSVYPIIYGGTTYIPVRGVSELMGENVEWEPQNQIVFIGKTISFPHKGASRTTEPDLWPAMPMSSRPAQAIVTIFLKPNVKIMYDFELQSFRDVDGKVVYPIIYNGTTYLPVRAISKLMGASIEWDSTTQTVAIDREIPSKADERSIQTIAITDLFNQAVDLYNQSTAKISILQSTIDPEILMQMAKGVSADYQLAMKNTALGKEIKLEALSVLEAVAHQKLMDFLELAEYYTLVLENISYMAVNGQDYSMYAETFLTFAMESEDKMNLARAAIDEIQKGE